jgi:uncharacterized protein (TIGR03083 family)
MASITVDMTATKAGIETALADVMALLSGQPDFAAPVPGLDWTARETLAHLVTMTEAWEGFALGTRIPEDDYLEGEAGLLPQERVALVSDRLIRAFQSADTEFGERLQRAVSSFLASTASLAPDTPMRSWEAAMDVATATAALLEELLVHGHDVAKALARPFTIDPDLARLAIFGISPLWPVYVDTRKSAGLTATFELRLGAGLRLTLLFAEGGVTLVREPAPRADCRITADPVTYLLLGMGRIGRWRPILSGKVVAWGRKPWLGLRLDDLFYGP